jgi:fatty acid desaturase
VRSDPHTGHGDAARDSSFSDARSFEEIPRIAHGTVTGVMTGGRRTPTTTPDNGDVLGGTDTSAERAHRQRVNALVGSDELAALSQPSMRDTVWNLAVIWIEIIALLVIANLLSRVPLVWAVAPALLVVVAIATRINALSVVMHEGSHGFLARRRVVNDRVCNAAAAWWMLHSVEEYRPAHRLHHRYLHQSRDPDVPSYLIGERRGALTGLLLQDLMGVTAFRRALTLLAATSDASAADAPSPVRTRTALRNLAGKAIAQLVILGQFVLFQGLWRGLLFYAVFWLVPVLCIFPLLLRLKTVTEHFDPRLRDDSTNIWVARTSAVGRIQDHIIGARMEYHFEHHVVPTVPYRGLRRLHETLEARGFFADSSAQARADELSGGYVRFVSHLSTLDRSSNRN